MTAAVSVPQSPRTPLGEKTSVAAARILRTQILSGELKPGQTLGEEQLGRQFGISRTPVREALVLLRSEGLVETPANRPATVRTFKPEDLHEMYSIRAVLEAYASEIAATSLTEEQLERLQRSCERSDELGRRDDLLPELEEENRTFHSIIYEAAGSERLTSMILQLTTRPFIYQAYLTYSVCDRKTVCQDHVRLLAALRGHDAKRAEALMKAHVLWSRDIALEHLALPRDGRS